MNDRKTLFRRVFESMIERRTNEAQRHITEYLKARQPNVAARAERFTGR